MAASSPGVLYFRASEFKSDMRCSSCSTHLSLHRRFLCLCLRGSRKASKHLNFTLALWKRAFTRRPAVCIRTCLQNFLSVGAGRHKHTQDRQQPSGSHQEASAVFFFRTPHCFQKGWRVFSPSSLRGGSFLGLFRPLGSFPGAWGVITPPDLLQASLVREGSHRTSSLALVSRVLSPKPAVSQTAAICTAKECLSPSPQTNKLTTCSFPRGHQYPFKLSTLEV